MANIGEYFRQHLAAPDKALYRQCDGDVWRDVTVGGSCRARRALAVGASKRSGSRRASASRVCLKNGIDWVAVDLAALGLGLVVVPLYVDDNPDNVAWCVDNAEAKLLVVETQAHGRGVAGHRRAPAADLCPAP